MATLKRKVRTYKGFRIHLDSTDRYSVVEPSEDHEPNVIADRFISIGEALCWIDATQMEDAG